MSPHRQEKRMAGVVLMCVVAVVALMVSVWLVGREAARDTSAAEARAAVARLDQVRAGCARSVARDFESKAANGDLRALALRAGDDAIAARALGRMVTTSGRLPEADSPVVIVAFCRRLYPTP